MCVEGVEGGAGDEVGSWGGVLVPVVLGVVRWMGGGTGRGGDIYLRGGVRAVGARGAEAGGLVGQA